MPPADSPVAPSIGDRIPAPEFGVTIRFQEAVDLTDDENRAIIELLRHAYNGGPAWFGLTPEPLDHLHWKFRDYPGTAQAELLERDDQIVGMIFGMRRRWLVRGQEVWGRDGVDLALHPSIQGRGLQSFRSVELLPVRKTMFPEVLFTTDYATHPTARHLGERLETQPINNYIENHIRPLSLRRLFARARSSAGPGGASRTREVLEARDGQIARLLRRTGLAVRLILAQGRSAMGRTAERDFELRTITSFGADAEAFWNDAATAFDFIQVRDAEYLNWRFCDERGGRHHVRAAFEGDRMLGYAATRLGGEQAVLADLLTLPGRSDVASALVADAVTIAQADNASMIRAWLPRHHPYRAALRANGFASSRLDLWLGYQKWKEGADPMAFLADPTALVHMMSSDADHL